MRMAFISDIHGNFKALEAVLEDIEKKQVDRIAVLGDIAYRGPEPKKALDRVRNLEADRLKGNADEWMVRGVRPGEVPEPALEMMNKEREWCVAQCEQEDLDFLQGLPSEQHVSLTDSLDAYACHATPESLFDVVLPEASDATLETTFMQKPASLYFYAHIHLPYIRYINGKCLVNLGSVGLPFDGLPQASYVIVEAQDDRYRVTIERVPYDVEAVIEQYKAGAYPNTEVMARVLREAKKP